jgi:hypothetical protein
MNLIFLIQYPCLLPSLLLLHLLLLVHPLGDSFISTFLSHLVFDWLVFPIFSSSATLPSFFLLLLLVRLLSTTSQIVLFISLSCHDATSQLWRLSSGLAHLLSPLLVVSPIHQRPLPLSQAMNPPQPCPTQSEGVYASISIGEIVSIPSSIKKTLIHRGISLNSLPFVSFLKYSYASEKDW